MPTDARKHAEDKLSATWKFGNNRAAIAVAISNSVRSLSWAILDLADAVRETKGK